VYSWTRIERSPAMARAIATVILAAAVLAPAATAHAKAEVRFTPPMTNLQVGKPTDVQTQMRKVVGEETSNPHLVAAKGATPTITLTQLGTGRSVTYRATKADASGRSTARLLIPRAGVWQTRVDIGRDAAFEMEPISYEAPGKGESSGTEPVSQSGSSDGSGGDDGGSSALAIGGVAAAIAVAAAALTAIARRRGSRPSIG
jgi:hypothetical protein